MNSAGLGLLLLALCLPLPVSSYGKDSIGLLDPVGELAVSSSYTNQAVLADYSFTFIPSTTIPVGGMVQVTFPRQFSSGLGLTASPSCAPTTCTVSGYTVTFTLSSACVYGSVCVVQVNSVRNPASAGGTGPFQLVSSINNYVLDMNLHFGVIGIEQSSGTLTSTSVAVASGQSSYAGESTKYDFLFTVNKWTPKYSWFRFTFPNDDYAISGFPSCTALSINRYQLPGLLSCTTTGRKVTLLGFSDDINPGTALGIRISVTNPAKAITTGTFTIETGRNSTSTVYEQQTNIPGVTITAGRITGISLTPVDTTMTQSTNNVMRYTLVFTFTNAIEQGGAIVIACNNNFNLQSTTGPNLYWVNSGLSDISITQPVTAVYSTISNQLTITNFQAYKAGQVSLMLELTNPATSGTTLPLGIWSLKSDGTTIIDQDLVTAVTTISIITSPVIVVDFLPSTSDSNRRAAGPISLKLTLTPNFQIPGLGYITVKFPSSFTVTSPTCKMKPKNIGEDSANACVATNGVVSLQLKAMTTVVPVGSGNFLVGVDSYITITGITASSVAGKYSMELQTFDQNQNLLESGNALVTLVSSLFTSPAWNSVHSALSTKTVLTFKFTPTNAIPAGSIPATPDLTAQGFLEIILPTQIAGPQNLFPVDLGLNIAQGGNVPCLPISGMTVATGATALSCVLTVKPTTASPTSTITVTVSNFAAVAANTAVELHIAGVTHVATANNPSITLTAYQKLNRVRTDLNTNTATLTTAPVTAYSALGAVATAFTSTSTLVSSSTTLSNTFTPSLVNTPASLLFVLTSHQNGYCERTTGLTCSLGATTYTCYCYPTADLIYLITSVSLPAAATTFTLAGLVNPSSVPGVADSLTIYTISGKTFVTGVPFSTLPIQTPGTFTNPIVSPSVKGLGYVNVQLSFTLVPQHEIPSGGTVTILLPNSFSLLSSTPVPVCTPSQFTPLTGTAVSCQMVGAIITIGNYKTVPASSTVNVVVTGVKHPSSGSSTGYFTFTSYTSLNFIVDQNSAVPGYTFSPAYASGAVGILGFAVYPNNGKATAEYVITFSVPNSIPAGGSIIITFPIANFGTLPSPPDCRINGAASYFSSCTTAGSILTLVLSTSLSSSSITVSVFNIVNFSQGTSSPFSISTKYDGVVLDQSLTLSSTSLSITTSATAELLKVNSITADPLNEGEMSTYKFTVTPTYNVSIKEVFRVSFPSTYDRGIGENLSCSAVGLTGYVGCEVVGAWELEFTLTESFKACKTCGVTLVVYGVINPQFISGSTSGQFKIGIYSSPTYTELNEAAGTLTFISAPSYNNLYTFSVSNNNARDVNDWVLNMTMTQTIPQTNYKGAIWIQFPADYSLIAADVTCESSPYWAGGVPDCTVYNNRILLDGQVTDFVGNLLIYIYNVPNPLTEMMAKSVTAKTYDGLNFKVLDSSYANTNPTQVIYRYPGPLIIVNSDQMIYVERGTVSSDIPVQLSFPAALNLTLVPQADEFTFLPYTVSLSMGDLYKSFRIAVHESVPATRYVMTWTTEGDDIPAFYTPIQASIVMVTQYKNVQISIPQVQVVPVGGHSLPTEIRLQYAPDVDVTVSISVSGLEGLSVSPTSITFSAGIQSGTYVVHTTKDVTTMGIAEIAYAISGTNAQTYQLPFTSQPFNVGPDDGASPAVTGTTVEGLTRTSVTIRPQANKPGTIYYMYALYGTAQPDFSDVKARGPVPYTTTQSVYGNATVDSSLNSTISITGLTAQTPYVLFMYMEDLLDRPNIGCFYYNFTTSNRYATAHTQLRFTQSYLDEMEVESIVEDVGLLLSLDNRRVLTTSEVKKARRTASVIKAAYLDLYIIDNPASDNYPKPIDLLARLSSSLATLKSMQPTLDLSWNIPIEGFSSTPCRFGTEPTVTGYSSYYAISFLASLLYDGVVYAVVVESEKATGTPSSLQIAQILDSQNRPTVGVVRSIRGEVLTNTTISGLQAGTSYNLYVTCGNIDPGYPLLLSDAEVYRMSVSTALAPNRKSLNLNISTLLLVTTALWVF